MNQKVSSFPRILVAGGAGFVGSHIVDRLIEEDVEVVALDNLYTGKLKNVSQHKSVRRFRFLRGDIRNHDLVRSAIKDVDAVINEAAVVGVSRCVNDPVLANDVNVGGTLTLLTACLKAGVRRFIQASSASVYGNAKTLPIKETLAANPISSYAVSELAAENCVKVFHEAYGLETVCLRYFNVYGPRQAFGTYSGVIPIVFDLLAHDGRPIIFGDGEQTRDLVYVEDVVEANIRALTSKKAAGQVFNIGTGLPSTVNELVRNLQRMMDKEHLKPIYKPVRPGEIRHSYASIEKAKRILRYEPRVNLEEGLSRLVT